MKAVPHRVDRIRSRSRASVLRTGFALNCFGAPCCPNLAVPSQGVPFLSPFDLVSSLFLSQHPLSPSACAQEMGLRHTLPVLCGFCTCRIICSSSHPTRPPVCLGLGSVCALSRVRLFATPWTLALQSPLSTELSRQEYWSG